MIIESSHELEIGKIYNQDTNPSWVFYHQKERVLVFTIKIIRKSNRKEYEDFFLEQFGYKPGVIGYYFYEIQTD